MDSPSYASWHGLARSVFAVLLYASAIVWTSIYPSGWTVGVVAFPLVAALCSWSIQCWKSPNNSTLERLGSATLVIGVVLALCLLKPFLLQNFKWIYLIQHSGIHLALAWVFGSTLKAGATPLCTRLARIVHPTEAMPATVLRYTRQVTVAWTCFFLCIGLSSPMVLLWCPLPVWSLFSTVITLGLTAAMFVIEAMFRRRVVPAGYRSSFTATWRAVEHHFRNGHAL